ncbi:tetratricopeptide repeat protein [Undibacterium crateris]|uniref:tetratricopeptide repeat protein n=1 Tax=Undibacterium crateris TaxID=2528175 RepID=UPI00138A0B32|nr:tetratricopeptide repeat protein [Undibacterium crateris]NDI86378.1 tetratricopeptide repeat protein [Undibacterium crateris]
MKTLNNFVSTAIVAALRPTAYLACTVVLTACAGLGTQTALQPEDAHHARDAAHAALSAEKEVGAPPVAQVPQQDKLPELSLSPELLYKVMMAEVAYQRGSWQAAYVTLMSTAQETRDPRFASRSAEIALSAKQPSEALSAIRLWRELAPESNEAMQYYLGFMLMNNNLSEIRQVYTDRLKAASPEQYQVIMLQAQRLLSRARDKQAAMNMLEELLAPYQNFPEAHLALAQGAMVAGNKARALSEAQQVLSKKTDSQIAALTIAQASTQADAVKFLNSFLKKNPQARDVRLALASLLIELKEYDKAYNEFAQLLRDKPDDTNALYTLGVLSMERNQPEQAENYLKQYLKLAEDKPEDRDLSPALLNLSRIAIEKKDYQQALDWLSQIESYDGKNPVWFNVQIRRAHLLARTGNADAAMQLLKTTSAANEAEQVQLIQTEAQLLRDRGSVLEAGQLLREGSKKFPDNADLLYDYAMLLESQQSLEEMETSLRKVIALAPENQHAYNALGYSFADRNIRLDEALTLVQKANQLAPDDPYILDSLGWVYFRLGKINEAEKALRRAYEIRNDADIAAHLGELLWSKGDQDAAKKIWREAHRKDAGNTTLKGTLQRFQFQP